MGTCTTAVWHVRTWHLGLWGRASAYGFTSRKIRGVLRELRYGGRALRSRAHNTHETPITVKFYITQYIYSTYHTIFIPKGWVKSYIRATRTALGNCNPRSCRSKGIASCRTAEAAPGLQFFQYRSENGCARRWRAGGSHRWTRAT